MKQLILFLFLFPFLLSLSVGASAKEVFLVSVTNSQDHKFYTYVLSVTDDNRIVNFKKKEYANELAYEKKQKAYVTTFNIPKGYHAEFVLEQRLGNPVIVLETSDFDPKKGATINLKFAYDGPQIYFNFTQGNKGKGYQNKSFRLEEKEKSWVLVDSQDNKVFTKVHFTIRNERFLRGRPKGIKNVSFSGKR